MIYFEDIVVPTLFPLGSKTITEEEMVTFAAQFDPQPFHIDKELAEQSIFGGLCASGWHTASIYMRLMVDSYLCGVAGQGSGGVKELKWLKPVFPGDTLFGYYRIDAKERSRNRPLIGKTFGTGYLERSDGDRVLELESMGFVSLRNP